MALKITLQERAAQLPVENQSGICGFISYGSILQMLKDNGSIKPGTQVVGLEIDSNGIKYVLDK